MPNVARTDGYAKSEKTRGAILAAALAEASERGLHKTSVAGIARRANTAVGSVNYHYGSRGELLREMMRVLMTDLFEGLAQAGHDGGGDFFTRHRRELLAYVRYVRSNPAHIRLTDEIKFLEPDLYRRGVATWIDGLAARIREGITEGSVRAMADADVLAHAHFLLGSRHFLEDMLDCREGAEEETVDAYISLIREGLGARGAPKRSPQGST